MVTFGEEYNVFNLMAELPATTVANTLKQQFSRQLTAQNRTAWAP